MKNTNKTVVSAKADIIKGGTADMKILGSTLVIGAEKDYQLKDGTTKKVRPILINGAESQYRLYRSEKTDYVDGQNLTTVKWISSSKNPVTLKSMKALPTKKAFNADGDEYTYVPVEGTVPKGVQIAAFPSKFNKPGEAQAVRVLITVYSDFKD